MIQPLVNSPVYPAMPYYYPVYSYPISPTIPVSNLNYGGMQQQSYSQAQLPKDQKFNDSLDKEKSKYYFGKINDNKLLASNVDNSNIFRPGNHLNNFNPRSQSEIFLNKKKQNDYASMLQQQMQMKKNLFQEKKVLETKNDLALKLQRQQNDLLSFNKPSRDIYGNSIQSRSMPGNHNYQQSDWFTHLPNIDEKYLLQDQNIFKQNNNQQLQLRYDQQQLQQRQQQIQQQQQYTSDVYGGKQLSFNFPSRSLVIKSPAQQYQLQSYQQPEESQQLSSYQQEMDETAEDDSKKVRILTPTKYRRTSKGTQTPSKVLSGEETDLYPKTYKQEDSTYGSYQNLYTPSTTIGQTNSISANNSIMLGQQRQPTASTTTQNSSVRFTQQLRGDYKYANEYEKMMKRNQYIELQNEQLKQMEEKKRQKEQQRINDQRDRYLDHLKIERQKQELDEKEAIKSQNPFKTKVLWDDDQPLQFSGVLKKGKRPRTPLEEAQDPFDGRNIPSAHIKQFILKEIPLKVKEQVSEAVNGETSTIKADMAIQNGMVQQEIAQMKDSLAKTNQIRQEQEEQMGNISGQINATRFIDEIRRRELDQKLREKVKIQKQEQEQSEQMLLQQPGFAKYDFENKKKVFFDYDDPYTSNSNKFNQDITSILREGDIHKEFDESMSKPSSMQQKPKPIIRNNPNYITYEDNFEKSTKEILDNQQLRIEQRLNEMGLKSPDRALASKSPLKAAEETYRRQLYSGHNNNQNHSQMQNENQQGSNSNIEVDDVYKDLIIGNQENSKVFKIKRDDDAQDMDEQFMWNSKKARNR